MVGSHLTPLPVLQLHMSLLPPSFLLSSPSEIASLPPAPSVPGTARLPALAKVRANMSRISGSGQRSRSMLEITL